MSYLTPEQKQMGSNLKANTLAAGEVANVVLTAFAPFDYVKDGVTKTMLKHLGTNADTGETYEFFGFSFHEAVAKISDDIVEGVTVLKVECLDNGTKYPDYAISIAPNQTAQQFTKTEEAPF
jgi:hypothetical protein